MGILKRLGRALSNMANAPANLLGKGIEKLGEVTNIWPVEKFSMKRCRISSPFGKIFSYKMIVPQKRMKLYGAQMGDFPPLSP